MLMPDDFKNKGYDTSPLYKAAKTFNESLHELLKSIKKSATSKEIAELKHLQNLGVTFESKILPMFSKGKMPGLFQLNSLQNFIVFTPILPNVVPKGGPDLALFALIYITNFILSISFFKKN